MHAFWILKRVNSFIDFVHRVPINILGLFLIGTYSDF